MSSSRQGSRHADGSRLRSSCNACTDAKIGCTKEKPTCSRCARRDEVCVYAPARRAGRPNRHRANRAASQQLERAALSPKSPSLHMTPTSYPDLLPQFPDLTRDLSSHEVASLLGFSSLNQSDVNNYLDSISAPFDDLIAGGHGSTPSLAGDSGIGLNSDNNTSLEGDFRALSGGCETMSTLIKDGDGSGSGDTDMSNCLLPRDPTDAIVFPGLFNMPDMYNTHNDFQTPNQTLPHNAIDASGQETHGLKLSEQRRKSSSTCDCRIKCSNLLDKMAALRADASPDSSSNEPPDFEDVMKQNDSTIEIVREILDCACSNNNSSLYVLCFVIFETLGWYAATALAVKSSRNSKSPSPACSDANIRAIMVRPPSATNEAGSADVDAEMYQEHMIYQSIITKLYCVRRIGTSLSQRLLAAEEKSKIKANAKASLPLSIDNTSEGRLAAAAQDILIYGDMFQSPSAGLQADGIWKSLETGLRTRLKEVSQGIVEALREA